MEKITNVRNALSFLMRGLYDTHRELRDAFPFILSQTSSPNLQVELNHYFSNLPGIMDMYLGLFKTLNEPPVVRKNSYIFNLLQDLRSRLSIVQAGAEKDGQILRTIKIVAALQKADLISSIHFARELNSQEVVRALMKELDCTDAFTEAIKNLGNTMNDDNRSLAMVG
jgi:hypothetical protein